jgi:Protein of unknown function (DUF2798)
MGAKSSGMNNGRKVTKLFKKYYTLVFGVIMGSVMSVLTSLAVTIINIGIVHNFFEMWFGIFLTTFAIGFPMTIMIIPFVKNIADRITISETV